MKGNWPIWPFTNSIKSIHPHTSWIHHWSDSTTDDKSYQKVKSSVTWKLYAAAYINILTLYKVNIKYID